MAGSKEPSDKSLLDEHLTVALALLKERRYHEAGGTQASFTSQDREFSKERNARRVHVGHLERHRVLHISARH